MSTEVISAPDVPAKREKRHLLARLFRRLFKRKKVSVPRHFTWFERFLDDLDKNSDAYDRAQQAVDLCDDALESMSQRLRLIERLKDVSDQLAGAECFVRLSADDTEILKRLIAQYDVVSRDKNELKYQVTGFEHAVGAIEGVEDEARAALPEIREAEEKQRVFRQDLNYLQGERGELTYERETLLFAVKFAHRFSIIVAVTLMTVACALAFLYVFRDMQTLIPVAVLVTLIVALMWLMRLLGRRLRRALDLNQKKQVRAAEILSKKNVIYAHYTNYLRYEYKKFNVRSAEMLRLHLRDYESYKRLAKRFDSVRNIVKQTGEELESFLRTRRIPVSAALEPFATAETVEEHQAIYRKLFNEKTDVERQLAILDARMAEIWDRLTVLKDDDAAEGGAVEDVITAYLDLAGRMMERGPQA